MRPPLRLLALLCLLLANLALAQRCEAEMRAPFSAELFPQPATGRSAAKLLQRALDLLEPSLPPLRRVIDLPVARDDPDYDTFSYLADRELLPHPWPAEAFSLEAWRVATARLADWYGLAAPAFDEPAPSNEALLASLLELIEGASRAPQPVALLAADLRDGSRIAFWATLRNHGIYPRMIVLHPPEEPIDLRRNIGAALERLSTCATTLTNYVYAPADTAEQLFIATNESRMVILATEPASEPYLLSLIHI